MQMASFSVDTAVGPQRRVGVVVSDQFVDVTAAYGKALEQDGIQSPGELAAVKAPSDMQAFLERGDTAWTAAERAVECVDFEDDERGPRGARCWYDRSEVELLSPLPRPNSLRDFMAYEEHVENSLDGDVPEVWYELPVYYKGNPESVVHPGDTVEWPRYTEKLDYELELAAVIGTEGRDIDVENAEDYIAGYTIFNDFSARDIQMREMEGKLGPAKGKDFANGFGPYLVTADEIDVTEVSMTARVNGEEWSRGTPGEMYHSFADIIAYVSRHETLYPGDVIGSGTVGNGCGLELDRWIGPGDTVTLSVDGIGDLEHTIVKSG